MDNKAWIRAMALALIVPAAAACNKEDNDEATIEVETEAPAPPPAPITIDITPQGGAPVMGQLTATHEGDNTKVRLTLSGLTEDKTYDAKIRYGDCTIAMQYTNDDMKPDENAPTTAPGATATPGAPTATGEHKVGDEVADYSLNETGTAAEGEVDVDNDDLRPDEAAFVMVTEDAGVGKPDVLVGCADLRGHGGMGGTMPAPSTTPAPGTEPGAAAPADSGRR